MTKAIISVCVLIALFACGERHVDDVADACDYFVVGRPACCVYSPQEYRVEGSWWCGPWCRAFTFPVCRGGWIGCPEGVPDPATGGTIALPAGSTLFHVDECVSGG